MSGGYDDFVFVIIKNGYDHTSSYESDESQNAITEGSLTIPKTRIEGYHYGNP